MNKNDFIKQLENELSDVSPEERENALLYYKNYFEDAGPENEEKLISELNSPREIAEEIKRDLGFVPISNSEGSNSANKSSSADSFNGQNEKINENSSKPFFEKTFSIGSLTMPLWLFIVLLIILSPIILPAISGVFGTLVGIVFSVIGIAIGFFAASIAVIIAGIALIIGGIGSMISSSIFTGIFLAGTGLLLIGIGIFMLLFSLQLFIAWIPQFVRWIIKSIKGLVKKSPSQKGAYA